MKPSHSIILNTKERIVGGDFFNFFFQNLIPPKVENTSQCGISIAACICTLIRKCLQVNIARIFICGFQQRKHCLAVAMKEAYAVSHSSWAHVPTSPLHPGYELRLKSGQAALEQL